MQRNPVRLSATLFALLAIAACGGGDDGRNAAADSVATVPGPANVEAAAEDDNAGVVFNPNRKSLKGCPELTDTVTVTIDPRTAPDTTRIELVALGHTVKVRRSSLGPAPTTVTVMATAQGRHRRVNVTATPSLLTPALLTLNYKDCDKASDPKGGFYQANWDGSITEAGRDDPANKRVENIPVTDGKGAAPATTTAEPEQSITSVSSGYAVASN